MRTTIDLNSDLGEYEDFATSPDAEIVRFVSSVNLSCGVHAGTPAAIEQTARVALARGVRIGAHPSYPDRTGFGRLTMDLPLHELAAELRTQILWLKALVEHCGGRLAHVKPHGALYNMAARDRTLAEAVVRGVRLAAPGCVLLGLAGSALVDAARDLGVPVAAEAFADRAYCADGSLAPRSQPGAVIDAPEQAAARVLRMLRTGTVEAISGETVPVRADSICVHGDTPGAVAMAVSLRDTLERAGVTIRSFGGA